MKQRILEESQEICRLFSAEAADGICAVDLEGYITYVNAAWEQLFKISAAKAIGTHFKHYVHKNSLDLAWKSFRRAKQTETKFHEELNVINKVGEVFPVEVSVSPLLIDGKLIRVYAIVRDLRERQKLENLLRESEQKYHNLFEDAHDALLIVDLKGFIRDANRAAEILFQKKKKELVKTRLAALFRGEQHKIYFEIFKKDRDKIQVPDTQIIQPNGHVVAVTILGRRIKISGEEVISYRFTDLSDRIQQEEKARLDNKMAAINHFVAGAAKEIQYPLQIILTRIESILKNYKDRPFEYIGFKEFKNLMQVLEAIHNQIRYSFNITQNLVSLNKKKAGTKERSCDINRVILNVLDLLEEQIKSGRIRINLKLGPRLPDAAIGSLELSQVATNICMNAIQSMPGGGTVTIKTSMGGGRDNVFLEIKDEGVGIPKEILPRIFEPFFTTKQRGSGKSPGLGLSIVYSIVKAYQGDITINSSLRHGTTVKVILPILKGRLSLHAYQHRNRNHNGRY